MVGGSVPGVEAREVDSVGDDVGVKGFGGGVVVGGVVEVIVVVDVGGWWLLVLRLWNRFLRWRRS